MFFRGLKFGLLLQLAIGPVFLYVWSIAASLGAEGAVRAVAGVTLADALYILIALAGVIPIRRMEKARRLLVKLGAVVVGLFGIWMLISSLFLSSQGRISQTSFPFAGAFLLTLSSPLTVIFWAGLFSSRLADEAFRKRHVVAFAFGSLVSTPLFLGATAGLGVLVGRALPRSWLLVSNVGVGVILIILAFYLYFRKSGGPKIPRE